MMSRCDYDTTGTLPDGTEYPNLITLNAASKELTITATNSDDRTLN